LVRWDKKIIFLVAKEIFSFFRSDNPVYLLCKDSDKMGIINSFQLFDESELQFSFIRASGPGGQNVNKVATSVQLRFDVYNSSSLEHEVKERLSRLAGKRMTEDGILLITAQRYRTQEKNREDAVNRLRKLIEKATHIPLVRKQTKPSRASQEKRLQRKRIRSQTKRSRQTPDENNT
jgi:ribosome-associated protein